MIVAAAYDEIRIAFADVVILVLKLDHLLAFIWNFC